MTTPPPHANRSASATRRMLAVVLGALLCAVVVAGSDLGLSAAEAVVAAMADDESFF